jgi:pantetheine-phosphate adenylyltransferase
MKRTAVFPGSFDPVSSGHVHIAEKASALFDIVYVAVGENTSKNCMFDVFKRIEWLKIATAHLSNVKVISFSGLTVDLCRKLEVHFIVRGIRNASDLEYERAIADTNLMLAPEIQTVFLLSEPAQTSVRSTILRELIRNKSDVSVFLPAGVDVYE